ncbi:MAG: RHS repeat-associated core domain-containing protein, partial [Bacteroidota bacterium]
SISSNNGWISAAGSGSGNGSFNLNYDANTSSSSRTGSVTINGGGASATVTVTQAGASPQYTLTVSSSGGGSVTKNPNQTTYVSGTNVSLTPVAATGYTFSSWSGDASGSTNPLTVTMNGNKNITANFTLIQYTLTVNATNGTVAKNPNQSTYSYGANVTLTATPNAGYTFTNWTESGTVVFTSANYSFTVSASRNLVANFTSTGSSTNFLDETGKTVSVYGDAQISTAQSEFGGASGMFNGSNDSLSVSDNADWLLDAGNGSPFTIDFWMRLTSDGNTNQFLLSQANVPYSSYWDFYYTGSTSNKIIFRASGNLNIQCTPSFSTGIWYHIALERVNNTNAATGWRIFINGVSKTLTLGDGNWSDYIVDVSGSLIIGNSIGYNTGLKGYMDELRISKGIARWTSNFTPPASPYSVDSYTKLLMHMDGVSTPTYSISTTSNPSNGGTITPGDTTVNYGDSLRFSIKPSTGYSIKNIITDGGTLLPADTSYTFKNIASPHMITVIFAKNTNGLLRYYYVKDHLGSVRVTVDEAGEIKSYDDYDPWGMRLAGRSGNFGDANDKYKFTGKERDKETASTTVPDGLDYFGARYYDSRIGRFNSVDRLIDKYPSLSSYQYGGNNPILFIDVNGDSAWAITNQWTNETFKNYQTFAANYISTYKDKKIDCADLALTALVEYASQNGLPIDLRYYRDGSWQSFNAASDEFSSKDEYLSTVTNKLGALNIIDNTKPIALENAGAGDLIMSKLSEQMGHTRIIYDNIYDKRTNNSWIAFYSGTYPPDFVKKQEGSFNKLINIYGNSPRRWRFDLWH